METVTESEWSPDEVTLLLAARDVERERGPHGYSMIEATDPASEHKYEGKGPRVDWIEKARLDYQDSYFKTWDKKDKPVNRNGMIFYAEERDK